MPATPPSPPAPWLVGHLFQLGGDPLGFHERCAREHGDVVGVRLPGLRIYVVSHPELVDEVLRHNHKSYSKDILTRRLTLLLGQGLLTSEGEFWRRQRKMAQPFFNTASVNALDRLIVGFTQRMLSGWRTGETRNLHAEMHRLTLRIIARKLFSVEVDEEADRIANALEVMVEYFLKPWSASSFLTKLPLPANRRFKQALASLDEFLYRIIRQRRETPDMSEDLLGFLLKARDDDGKGMTDRQLRDELMTLFLAGHETTALSLTFSLYLLGSHPGIKQELQSHLDQTLGGDAPNSSTPAGLPLLSWVVQESMRLYPPAWSIGRQALEDVTLGGFKISKGSQIWMPQWVVHRDPRWFKDPLAFVPARWDPAAKRDLPRGAFFPFGDGPRVCIGNHFAMLETQLILATILQQFDFTLLDTKPPKLIPSVTLRPAHGILAVITSRVPALAAQSAQS